MKTFRKNESKWYIEYKTVGGDRARNILIPKMMPSPTIVTL